MFYVLLQGRCPLIYIIKHTPRREICRLSFINQTLKMQQSIQNIFIQ